MYKQKTLAKNITKYRKQHNLTQSELAERLFVSAQSVSKWETGNAQPDLENLCALSRILDVSADELLGLTQAQCTDKCFIGIDGGGTKTELIAFTENGSILKRLVLDGSNPNTVGSDKACSTLKIGIDSCLYDNTVGIFAGIAGCGSTENHNAIMSFLKKHYPNIKIQCTTDILNVIGSVPDVTDCVAAICGTGSVVYGYSGGELHRVGGWGYLLDSAGSGFDIGSEAVRVALAERDGVGPHSALTELVEQQLKSTAWDKINEIYKKPPSFLASFAPLVFSAAKLGDKVALEILEKNAERLTTLIKAIAERHSCNNTAIISGSLVSNDTELFDLLKRNLGDAWTITVPENPQIYGACISALRICNADTKPLEEKFKKEYKRLLNNA